MKTESLTGEKSATSNGAAELNRAAWDFSGCPEDELKHCCFYEYAMESYAIRMVVAYCRNDGQREIQEPEELEAIQIHAWFMRPAAVLAHYPGFPDKHWLNLDSSVRKKIVKRMFLGASDEPSPLGQCSSPHASYAGPDQIELKSLEATWSKIREELAKLAADLKTAPCVREWPTILGSWLGRAEAERWTRRLSNLSDRQLGTAALDLMRVCRQRIEKRHRPQVEGVIYWVDWSLRPHELKERFAHWAAANRVHRPRDRTGGHKTTPIERLKALGAKRLLAFLPKTGPKKTFAVAEDYTKEIAGEALYHGRKSWEKAQKSADSYLESFL